MKFRATVLLSGKTATGIRVPPNVVAELGSSKRPAVRVTIKGHTYRSTVAPMGGNFMLPISAEIRDTTGVKAGDEIDVTLALDTEPREVAVPPDLKAALAKDSSARNFFDGLSYSNRLRIVLSVEGAKSAETRQRRIGKAVEGLHEGRAWRDQRRFFALNPLIVEESHGTTAAEQPARASASPTMAQRVVYATVRTHL